MSNEFKDQPQSPMMKFIFLAGYYVQEDWLRLSSGAEDFSEEEIAEIETTISNKEPGEEKDFLMEILARMKEIRSSC